MKCRVCGSDDVAKVSVVWEQGSARSTSSGIGIGATTGGVGLGVGIGDGHSVTREAARLAPPKQQAGWGCAIGLLSFLGILFLGGALVAQIVYGRTDTASVSFIQGMFWFSLVSSVLIGVLSGRRMARIQGKQLGAWLDSWVCRRCGHTAHFENFQ